MIFVLIGFFAGIIGGMGMGGGTILIPALVIFCSINPKIAQSVNLLSSIPMTIFALFIHIRRNNVERSIVFPLAITGVLGAILGSFVANYIPADILKRLFGVFLLLVGILEIKKGLCNHEDEKCGK